MSVGAAMRAAVLEAHGAPLRIASLPVPQPGTGELLVRLEASGVCHTDVHVWQGEAVPAAAPAPFILGHEGIGRVAALGPEVTGWTVGARAGVPWLHDTCGDCPACRSGQESFCQRQRAHGFDVPGTFAEYVVTKAAFTARVPEGDAAAAAPLMCAGLTAFGALDRAALAPGETCAVFGCGGLGLYAVQLASRRGAGVIAIDSDPAKLALATRLGAAEAVAAADLGPDHAQRAEVAINFAPTAATWQGMTRITRPLGRIIAAAMVEEAVPLSQSWLTSTGISVSGTSVGTRAQMQALLALHTAEPLRTEVSRIPLDGVNEALTALAAGRAPGRFCVIF